MGWKKLIYSGSNAELLSVTASSFSGSFFGDGSGLSGIVALSDPAGPNTSVQFNDAGSSSGSANFTFDKTANILYLTGSLVSSNITGSLLGTASYVSSIKTVGITIDGAGSVISTGIKGDITIPFTGYITGWFLTADTAGSIVLDVWKNTFASFPPTVANTIAGTEKPTLSSATSNSDTNLTTWTTSIAANDVIRFNVDSVDTVTRVNLVLKINT